ncbi:MAG: hypothetical protein VX028_02235 [Nanoarchaeota archaeon]|nr:hypothetical protein [Nanoarchaeota archaeon]
MNSQLDDVFDILEMLLEEDMPSKIRVELNSIFNTLKNDTSTQSLIKVQDEVEALSNNSQLDDFMRNELINLGPLLESIYNS